MSTPIVDAACPISSGNIEPVAITGDELVVQMDRAGVEPALMGSMGEVIGTRATFGNCD